MASRAPTPPDTGPEAYSAGATRRPGPNAYAAASGRHAPQAPRRRRWLRRFVLGFAAALGLLLLAALLAWRWLGSDDSLAYVLQRAAQALPAGQELTAEGVRGSVRRGGHIDRLRWQDAGVRVEAQDITIGWRLAPLLGKSLELSRLEAARVVVTPLGTAQPPDTPRQPPEQLTLPLRVDIPFAVHELVWAAETPRQATALTGRYRYDAQAHRLEISNVNWPQGQASATLRLDGAAPMALQATLQAQLLAPLPGAADTERRLGARVQAQASGTLAGPDAQIALNAKLHAAPPPATPDTPSPTEAAEIQADLSARLTPWQAQPLLGAEARFDQLDLALLTPQAPASLLSGSVSAQPTGEGWRVQADIANARPAPWDQGGLPLDAATLHATFDGNEWRTSNARIQVGPGALVLEGRFAPQELRFELQAQAERLDPARLHTQMAAAPLGGRASAKGNPEAFAFDLDLSASKPTARSKAGGALHVDRVVARGRWEAGVLQLPQADIQALQARIQATALRLATRPALAFSGKLQARLPGSTAQAEGTLAARSGAGSLRLQAASAQQTLDWLRALPGLADLAPGWALQGSADLEAAWRGGWQNLAALPETAHTPQIGAGPQVRATLRSAKLRIALPGAEASAAPLELRGLRLQADGSAARAELTLQGELGQGRQSVGVQAEATARLAQAAGQDGLAVRAEVRKLALTLQDGRHKGPWALQTGAPFAIDARRSGAGALSAEVGAGSATLNAPLPGQVALRWEPLAIARAAAGGTTLRTRGTLSGIPLAWADLASTQEPPWLQQFGLDTDLVFGGHWAVDAGDALNATLRLARSSGDLRIAAEEALPTTSVQSTGTGTAAQPAKPVRPRADTIAAGLRDAALTLEAQGEALRAAFTWDSAQAGTVRAEAATRLQRQAGGWVWPADAPLSGTVHAALPQVGVWSVLAPPGWRISGTLQADATLSGTRGQPQWRGQFGADQLRVRSLLDGVDLQDGRLRATLAGTRVDITEFSLKGGAGSRARIAGFSGNRTPAPSDGGSLQGSGSVQWSGASASGLRMDFEARADHLQVLVRADRQASVSGTLHATLRERQFKLRGDLRIDRASILLPDAGAPRLGSDVVVRSKALDAAAHQAAQQVAGAAQRAQVAEPPDVAITLDLGDDFAFQGQGITTRLQGQLDIRSAALPGAPPRVTGEVRTVAGRYRAWGQTLDVETGLLRFSGAYDNPTLDILALRPNIEVRAGVQVTGSAQDPRVRLYSEPELPDAEKLSWVVLGRSAAAGGAEAAMLQQAALALLGGKGSGTGTRLAGRLGLDEIGFKGPGNGNGASGAALTFGKRLSQDLYLTYERSLAGTLGTLYIFYDLSERLRLRAQTGTATGLDLIYTMRYE